MFFTGILIVIQVRVHVLEARKLLGGQLNPVVKVVCGSAIKETSSRKGTNNPLFNEVLLFKGLVYMRFLGGSPVLTWRQFG